jgi:hypothetical protein
MESLGIVVQGVSAIDAFDLFQREDDDPAGEQMLLRTGNYAINPDMSWRDEGQFLFYSEDPLPATVRGIVFGATGDP